MDIEQFRRAGYQAIDHICDYYYSLRSKAVAPQVEPGYIRRALPSAAPQTGEAFEKVVQDYHKLIVPGLMHWQHPRFFAYFPTASTFEAILGDLYANGIGPNPGFNWSASPACTELEAVVMDWAAEMLGLDATFHNASGIGGGVLQTSASDSSLVATVAARSRFIRQHPNVPAEKLVLYTTTQTHSLGKKAGLVLGLNVRALAVTSEDNYALRGATLKRALEEDAEAGMHPFMLIATVGTTSSGAIDRLEEFGDIFAAVPSLWLHVDAAWAGVSMACPEYRDLCLLDDINKYADSVCTNFHKWGLVTFDCSTLWVRERKNLTDALDITPEFLRSKHGDAGTVIDYRNWHLGLGRRFRALKLWFVLRSYGVRGFQRYIRQTVQRSDTFVSLIKQSAHFRLITPPCLSLSVFRLEPPARSFDQGQFNALNRAFYARLSARQDVAFTQTDLNGTICIRCAVGAERTEEADILQAYEVLCEEASKTLDAWDRMEKREN
ncbi:pyridoxal phosphate-dependent transferase [Boletus edulis]|uniref:Pyridoxal phosphate-dependent transferase n=1 Tax=Boletus edulis BED1 TaxID=1328754 RepID=A0AAD4C4L7_BOLED|nr:pyridoxal phosphate-dependent transferase [Boletus edulis]KAF8448698.1 pyridoxal phosphate-dependent transferase [Boletus edulis BED1]